jgi:hypothetical protein
MVIWREASRLTDLALGGCYLWPQKNVGNRKARSTLINWVWPRMLLPGSLLLDRLRRANQVRSDKSVIAFNINSDKLRTLNFDLN